MTLRQAYQDAVRRLRNAGISDPAFDAACILEKNTGIKRHELPLKGDTPAGDLAAFRSDVERRERREPLQYILGEWEFMGLRFSVGSGVLIPRPDTELLAGCAIEELKTADRPAVLELCGGSGCVSVSIAKFVPGCRVYCLELSGQAISYLRGNLASNEVEDRVKIIEGDMLNFEGCVGIPSPGSLDAVVCNPPYIRSEEIGTLQAEVGCYEPHLALDGGPDGLLFYRAAQKWLTLLKAGGAAIFEVGAGQARDVTDILHQAGLNEIFVKKDYGGVERVVGGRMPAPKPKTQE
ncbi:MAG TPA: peptide chain release factor N(5)-glutamine methyltransferase [Clostridia bacterium]|nr:peptide chain release factor N(5)-glutamine methyltransferase [Clostridia bacterium]